MSMPALMAMAMASFFDAATWSRSYMLLMSAQSVTIMPSQLRPSLSHTVSSSWLACMGMPSFTPEFTMSDSAPACIALRKGSK